MSQIRPYSLDGDRSIEPLVMRSIDDPHSALSKLADDPIPACGFQNALPDRIIPHGRVVVLSFSLEPSLKTHNSKLYNSYPKRQASSRSRSTSRPRDGGTGSLTSTVC